MSFKVNYDPEGNFVTGTISGKVDTEVVREYADEVTSKALQHDCKKFLNDMTNAEITLSTTEIFTLSKVFEKKGIDMSWRRAIVVSKQLDDYQFFETVAFNQAYSVRVFTDRAAAKDWLKE